jgi:DNA repair exonuclease SbcCD ATPase subunit
MLHSARFENFGPHKLFEHEFPGGITLVLGPNGVGKSHLLYGVGWTVFGHKALPDEYKQSDIIHDGEKFCSGEVTLDLLGQPHTFSRSYDGKNIQAAVYRGDEEVATGARGVEDWLARYGITWDAAKVLFSRQRELDAFVYETPAERKKIFESLLRVEVVNQARKIARARQAENTVEPDPVLAETTLEALEIEAGEARMEWEASKIADDKLVISLEAANSAKAAALEVLTSASTAEKAEELQGYLRLKRQRIGKLQARLDQINPTILAAPVLSDEKVAKYNERIAFLEVAASEFRDVIQSEVSVFSELRDKRGLVLGKIEALDATLQRLQDGECPTCGTEIADPEKHVLAVHDVSRDDLEVELDEVEAEIAASEKRTSEAQAGVESSEAERITMSSELSAFEYAVSLVPEATQIKSDIADAEKDAAGYEAEIRGLSGPTPEQRDVFEDADAYAKKKQEECVESTRYVRQCELQWNDANGAVEYYREAQIQAADGEENRKHWAAVSKGLDQFRNQVLQSALNWVSLRATQIVRTIGTLPGGGPTVQLSLDKDLQFWFTNEGKDVPVYRFSGGQKAVFAICLRMALSEYFSDRLGLKGFLLLDAVLDSLTVDNQDATASALQAAGPQQAILFSHFDVNGLEAHRVRL